MSKERLVELLSKKYDHFCDQCGVNKDSHYIESLADYLLANGVIVPLVKVGDTVYETDGIRIYELEVLDIFLNKNKPYYETESIDFDDDAIGTSIFLTREEAEAKLKEGESK